MQRRLIRKLDLELFISQITPHPTPKPNFEQYTIPADVAATMLHVAAYTYNDVVGKRVLDLGCGTGRLALGAAYLGAKHVVGVDIDKKAVKVAFEHSVRARLKNNVQWINGDVDVIHGHFDTALQNPPFGVQKRSADRNFLKKALETCDVVYSLHKHPERNDVAIKRLKATRTCIVPVAPSPFLEDFVVKHGGRIKAVYCMIMMIPYMFSFHTKKRHEFLVDLYVIEKR